MTRPNANSTRMKRPINHLAILLAKEEWIRKSSLPSHEEIGEKEQPIFTTGRRKVWSSLLGNRSKRKEHEKAQLKTILSHHEQVRCGESRMASYHPLQMLAREKGNDYASTCRLEET